jgi:hypothetical protein
MVRGSLPLISLLFKDLLQVKLGYGLLISGLPKTLITWNSNCSLCQLKVAEEKHRR